MDSGFYVGSLGRMRALPWVDGGTDATLTRIGGADAALEGRQWRDTLGFRRTWQWKYENLLPAQLPYLEALHYGQVRGPIRLIDPRRTNRLPVQIAGGGSASRSTDGFAVTQGGLQYSDLLAIDLNPDTLPMQDMLLGCQQWKRPNAGAGVLYLTGWDAGLWKLPLRPTPETLIIEGWVGGQAGLTPELSWVEYRRDGSATGYTSLAVTDLVALSASSWQYVWVAMRPQASTVGISPRLTCDASQGPGPVFTTGWQVRSDQAEAPLPGLNGPCSAPDELAGGWRVGGGAPEVIADPGVMAYAAEGFYSTGLVLTESEGE